MTHNNAKRLSAVLMLGVILAAGCNKVQPEKSNLASNDTSNSNPPGQLNPPPTDGARERSASDSPVIPIDNADLTNGLEKIRAPDPNDTPETPDGSSRGQVVLPPPDNRVAEMLADAAPDLASTKFARLLPTSATTADKLIAYVDQVDDALRELVTYGSKELIDQETFNEGGLRLGGFKLAAAERLIAAPNATEAEIKRGKVTKLVALSHLSGLQDVKSAQRLNEFARELSQSEDPDLEHEGRVVLLGFEVQSLRNGITTEPARLVNACQQLLKSPEHRRFPELVAVQNAASVMHEMGFEKAMFDVLNLMASTYQAVPEKQLRDRAWGFSIGSRPVAQQFFAQLTALDQGNAQPGGVAESAKTLLAQHPYDSTAEQVASTIGNLEAAGYEETAEELVPLILDYATGPNVDPSQQKLLGDLVETFRFRQRLIDQPFELSNWNTIDGRKFESQSSEGNWVLLEFWDSLNIASRRELKSLNDSESQLSAAGIQVIGVCMDQDLQQAQQFLESLNNTWIHLLPNSVDSPNSPSLTKRFGTGQLPYSVLIDPQSRIRKLYVRAGELVDTVDSLSTP
ncbi:MAG TPA: hypothetical protein DDW52_22535 [Planctomycetaceae bacterium]|nr:hypothetical protein [Planctomycetaceae bacterium]